MIAKEQRDRPWIITGMHRSGTTFAAVCLRAAGVDIGRDLLGPAIGNPRGLFENRAFVEFHKGLLRAGGWDELGWSYDDAPIPAGEPARNAAQSLIAENARDGHWGWKDPRTTLFLEFWRALLPAARFIFIYRSPWDAIDSLFRRGTDQILRDDPLRAIDIWLLYTRRIVAFKERHPDQCLICQFSTLGKQLDRFFAAIEARWHAGLTMPATVPVAGDELRTMPAPGARREGDAIPERDAGRKAIVTRYFPEACELYRRMVMFEKTDLPDSPAVVPESVPRTNPARQAFQDWNDVCELGNANKILRHELGKVREQCGELRFANTTANSMLSACQVELAEYQRLLRAQECQLKIISHRFKKQEQRVAARKSGGVTRATSRRIPDAIAGGRISQAPLKTVVWSARADLPPGLAPIVEGLLVLHEDGRFQIEVFVPDEGSLCAACAPHKAPVLIREGALVQGAESDVEYNNRLQVLAAELVDRGCELLVALSLRAFYAVEAARIADIQALWFIGSDERPADLESMEDLSAALRAQAALCFSRPYRLVVPAALADVKCWPSEAPLGNIVAMPPAAGAAEFLAHYGREAQEY